MTIQPTFFISHGGPNIVTDDTPARDHLMALASTLPAKPLAIVIASAHFETDGPVVVSDPSPEMIYDFRGFASELYEMVYTAPGDPGLATRVKQMLDDAGLPARLENSRGYDHGTWTSMKLAFPDADVPIVQISIDPSRDATYHHRLGAALAPLGKENVLVIGSGHITHNLRLAFSAMRDGINPDPQTIEKMTAFTNWMKEKLHAGDTNELLDWTKRAPYPQDNHPTDEHLMPLFFAMGAAGEGASANQVHDSAIFGFFAFDCYRFERS